jgi:hypothetical protein
LLIPHAFLTTDNEIRFWKDYINGADYMYDDKKKKGGLKNGERFVIIGDQNCDPVDGDAALKPINSLLDDPLTDTTITPTSVGAEKYIPEAKPDYSNPETKTGKFIHNIWLSFWTKPVLIINLLPFGLLLIPCLSLAHQPLGDYVLTTFSHPCLVWKLPTHTCEFLRVICIN